MIALEDNFSDVLGKAQRGLGLSDTELAEKARVSSQKVKKLREGEFDELALLRVAGVLNLAARALCELANGEWHPEKVELDGLAQVTTHYHDMLVNAYLVWVPGGKEAIAFDTGADCSGMLSIAEKKGVKIQLILLTHAHPDHIADLARLKEKTGAPVYISSYEPADGSQPIEEGKDFKVGKLRVSSRLTWGHSRGGMTYVVEGLQKRVAVVGDSLFAGSMGGGSVSYEEALKNNLEKILSLPDDTIVCPGHGPMTTVGEEKSHNPFFAGQI
jgi:glyoxylase-like metal-dependent hydrolase (beta-lactamase superfamily II)